MTREIVRDFGFITYLSYKGHTIEVELSQLGECVFYCTLSQDEIYAMHKEYVASEFRNFDKHSKMLRDKRNKICCPRG